MSSLRDELRYQHYFFSTFLLKSQRERERGKGREGEEAIGDVWRKGVVQGHTNIRSQASFQSVWILHLI